MINETFTCINCPMGCQLSVEREGDNILSVQGYACKRGETYARQESVMPMRMITASALVSNREEPVSLKTRTPVPKSKISACMEVISQGVFEAPIHAGDVMISNICDTGVDVIATRSVE